MSACHVLLSCRVMFMNAPNNASREVHYVVTPMFFFEQHFRKGHDFRCMFYLDAARSAKLMPFHSPCRNKTLPNYQMSYTCTLDRPYDFHELEHVDSELCSLRRCAAPKICIGGSTCMWMTNGLEKPPNFQVLCCTNGLIDALWGNELSFW